MIFTHYTPETDPTSIPRTDVLVLVSLHKTPYYPEGGLVWQQARYFGPHELPQYEPYKVVHGTGEKIQKWVGPYMPAGWYMLVNSALHAETNDQTATHEVLGLLASDVLGWQPLPPAVVPVPVQWAQKGQELWSTNTDRFWYRIRRFGGGNLIDPTHPHPLFLLLPREFGPHEPMAAGTIDQLQHIATMDNFMHQQYQHLL
jgi:hypothetical protein